MSETLTSWKHCWRIGVAPLLTTENLETLRKALADDDKRIMQKGTTDPPPLQCFSQDAVERACPIAFCGWMDGLKTVDEVETFFAALCAKIDEKLGETGGCRWVINWIDDVSRTEMRTGLLIEVQRSLAMRLKGETEESYVGPGALVKPSGTEGANPF